MDYTSWSQMPQNPPLNPSYAPDPYAPNPYPTQNCYYSHPQNPNPNVDPNSQCIPTLIQPPGTEPYQTVDPYTLTHSYTYQQSADGYLSSSMVSSSAYYQDPNLVVAADPATTLDYYGLNQYAPGVAMPGTSVEQLVGASTVASSLWIYPTNQPQNLVNKTKVVQSVWCEICNLECNTKNVLELHKLGKKHKKNQEKLIQGLSSTSTSAPISNGPIIGPPENPTKTKIRKIPGITKDLETKRRKVLNEGAEAGAVRSCALCNVVCNSDTVFMFHLSGKKHLSMLRKRASGK